MRKNQVEINLTPNELSSIISEIRECIRQGEICECAISQAILFGTANLLNELLARMVELGTQKVLTR